MGLILFGLIMVVPSIFSILYVLCFISDMEWTICWSLAGVAFGILFILRGFFPPKASTSEDEEDI